MYTLYMHNVHVHPKAVFTVTWIQSYMYTLYMHNVDPKAVFTLAQ